MKITDFPIPQATRPAARDELAAAGPVEPSSSPDLAPGPTLSAPPKSRAGYFCRRRTDALVSQARVLYRRGENFSCIGRALAVSPDTARRWLDPDYDLRRRDCAAATIDCDGRGNEVDLPTLPFVPGIVISGRYRMQAPP